MKIKREDVFPFIKSLKNGTIYSATFIKKDGSRRVLNSIKGSKKGIKGTGMRFNPSDKKLITALDLQLRKQKIKEEQCWRMINTDTVEKIRVNKIEYIVESN